MISLRHLSGVLVLMPSLCMASINCSAVGEDSARISLKSRENLWWKPAMHEAEFADILRTNANSRCEVTEPPEALTTPNPLLSGTDHDTKVSVSLIVGTDGRVHSPLILESAGENQDRAVLDAVRHWRYRPAMCNGVPTEAEGKVEFSRR